MSGIMARPFDGPCRLIVSNDHGFHSISLPSARRNTGMRWTAQPLKETPTCPMSAWLKQYRSLVTLESTEARERWQRAVLAAPAAADIGEVV